MSIVFYVSGHGFGHATRSLEVVNHLLERRPDCPVVVRSSVPRWFIERSVRGTVSVQACQADTGVAQIDSLTLDESETARQAACFYATFDVRAAAEAAELRQLKTALVVGDVPPLAFAAAALAGIPSVAFANFTWDWIYEGYPRFEREAPGVLDVMRRAYAQASLALRLPFHGGFVPMGHQTVDVPLVARRSTRPRQEIRALLDLESDRPVVLASFGGHATRLPFIDIARRNDLTLVLTDYEADDTGDEPRLRCFAGETLAARGLRYEDLVAAVDVVVSKPGYGIVSESIANQASLLYTSRGHFVENNVLLQQMSKVLRCRFIGQDALRAGDWRPSIEALLAQPPPPSRMDASGATVVANAILSAAGSAFGS